MLLTDIRPISANVIQLWSWFDGKKKATLYFHGEFSTMGEVVESVCNRKKELGINPSLGEYSL